MPTIVSGMDALKARISGSGKYDPEPPRRENPVERAVKEQSRAITVRMEQCVEAMERCAEAMANASSRPAEQEEWDVVVTQRDGPHIKSVKFRRIK